MTRAPATKDLSLGIKYGPNGGQFSAFSANATKLTFCILGEDRVTVTRELELERAESDIWIVESPLIEPGIGYVLRADGPSGPRHGFRPELNLIDPYAKGVVRRSAREYYNVAIEGSFDWQGVAKPNVPLDEAIIYEAHARGLTRATRLCLMSFAGPTQPSGMKAP